MGQALYRKYRSKNFSEVVGQEHITKTLLHTIKSGKVSHAYLFTGPRGVGKTSVARILAHEVNNLPYNDESIHLDIIEIDAASNRRIDEIRELRDKVHITPTSAKYKVYIIDEVHMLTREAFNALLKTLEEPPAHCIFILATTEIHKLPETIISRTQRFTFKPVDEKTAAAHLKAIAKKEKINITDEALDLLAQHGQGSFRDSIGLLDQLSSSKEKITAEKVRELIGLPPQQAITNLTASISSGSSRQLLEQLEVLAIQGINAAAVAKELGHNLRTELIKGSGAPWIARLLRQLLEVPGSISPVDALEIALLEAAAENNSQISSNPSKNVPKAHSASAKEEEKVVIKSQKIELQAESIEASIKEFDLAVWPQIVAYAKSHNASLYTALKLTIPIYINDTLTLNFQFPLHQKKLSQAPQKALIGEIIEKLTGCKVKVECTVDKTLFNEQKKVLVPERKISKSSKSSGSLEVINSIFGEAEMVES